MQDLKQSQTEVFLNEMREAAQELADLKKAIAAKIQEVQKAIENVSEDKSSDSKLFEAVHDIFEKAGIQDYAPVNKYGVKRSPVPSRLGRSIADFYSDISQSD
jgi:DNA-binding ferritin-like protein (Dps family)